MKAKTRKPRLKIGDLVYDRWWPWLGGKVCEIRRTAIVVDRGDCLVSYDKAHQQFVTKVEPGRTR